MDNKTYYENFNWDEAELNQKLKDKIQQVIKLIPFDVNSIVDIGCGDGSISNALAKHYIVVAADRSFNSLKYVKTNKIQLSADALSFPDHSFDMVFSSEMIEHLPDEIFEKAIEEFQRVSNKYIMLSFPNKENIGKNLVECINCKTRFNKSYHLRSLSEEKLANLLLNYKVVDSFKTSTPIRRYNKYLLKIKHTFASSDGWIPKHWTPDGRRSTMCPACNTKFEIPKKFSLIGFICDSLNTFLSPKKPYQICVLFERV